jgi:hypothetical protein
MKQRETPNETPLKVCFVGTIPPIARAIDFHGDGGSRLQLDIPDDEKAAALHIAAYMLAKRLRVTFEVMG